MKLNNGRCGVSNSECMKLKGGGGGRRETGGWRKTEEEWGGGVGDVHELRKKRCLDFRNPLEKFV